MSFRAARFDDATPEGARPASERIGAALVVQHALAQAGTDVARAEDAVASERERMGSIPSTHANTARWLRDRLEGLRKSASETPAITAPDLRRQAEEISESADALRALAERTR